MKKLWIAIMFLAPLSCCRATGPKFSPMVFDSSSKSVIYIYRPADWTNCVFSPDIFIDGQRLGSIVNGGYIAVSLRAGQHKVGLMVKGWDDEYASVQIRTQTGQSGYVRVEAEFTYTTSYSQRRVFRLVPASDDVAIKEITKCRQIRTVEL